MSPVDLPHRPVVGLPAALVQHSHLFSSTVFAIIKLLMQHGNKRASLREVLVDWLVPHLAEQTHSPDSSWSHTFTWGQVSRGDRGQVIKDVRGILLEDRLQWAFSIRRSRWKRTGDR